MPYDFVADGFHTKNIVADFLQAKCVKTAVLRFCAPLGGLGTTYNVYLGLIGKRVVDFLLVLNCNFFPRCYG